MKEKNKFYISQEDSQELEDYNEAIRLNPKDNNTLKNRGFLYFSLKQYDDALKDFNEMRKINPDDAKNIIRCGVLKFFLKRYDEALEDYNEAMRINPDNGDVWSNRGSLYCHLKQYDDALEDFNEAIRIDPNDSGFLNNRGFLYFSLKQYDDALEDYKEAIRINPDNYDALNNRGYLYYHLKRYDDAMEDYNKAIWVNPDDSRAFNHRGHLYYHLKRYDDALEDYNEAIMLNPNDSAAFNNRGILYYDLKQYDNALEDYNEATRIDPSDHYPFNNRGNVYRTLKQYDKSLNDYNEAIRINPEYSDAFKNRGNVYYDLKQYDNALKGYNEAIRIDPNNHNAFHNRGNFYRDLKQYDKSLNDYNEAIRINPEYNDAFHNRGNFYRDLKQYDKSLNDYNEAIRINPNDIETIGNRGILFYHMKLYNNALEDYNEVIRINPDYKAFFNRGLLFYRTEQYNNALSDYNEAIKLNSNENIYYFYCGRCYDLLNQKNEANTYFNTYIYRCISKNEQIEKILTLIDFYELKPQMIITILEFSNIDQSKLFFSNFEKKVLLVNDFSLLLNYYKVVIEEYYYLSIQSILFYYLGDSVSSFRIFDEQLNNGEYLFSSQELFYYALTAQEVNIKSDVILVECIGKILDKKVKTPLDYYYLAQLFLLQGNNKKAIEYFAKSEEFIFSLIMLTYLLEPGNKYEKILEKSCLENIHNTIQTIDYKKKDLSQFQYYFHFNECINSINSTNNLDKIYLYFDKYTEPIWNVFKLSPSDTKSIESEMWMIEGTKIYQEILIEFKIEKNINYTEDEIVDRLLENIFTKKSDRKEFSIQYDILKNYEELKLKNKDIEKQIGISINEMEDKAHYCMYFIYYYYFKGKINEKQAFDLILYLRHTVEDIKFQDVMTKIINLGIATIPCISEMYNVSQIYNVFKLTKKSISSFQSMYRYYQESEMKIIKDKVDYEKFKDNLWKLIRLDKVTLSESEFNQKYLLFDWGNEIY